MVIFELQIKHGLEIDHVKLCGKEQDKLFKLCGKEQDKLFTKGKFFVFSIQKLSNLLSFGL